MPWTLAIAFLFSWCAANELHAQSRVNLPTTDLPTTNIARSLPTFTDSSFDRIYVDDTRQANDMGVILRRWEEQEQRSREVFASTDELSWRLRRVSVRERRLSGFNGASLVVWDEDYLDSRDRGWGAESAFEQNRTFAGLKWRLTPERRSQLELGYLNQTWDDPGQDDRRFHFLSLNFYF